eukprot:3922828-Alexandrium_andersonii.AAC.1
MSDTRCVGWPAATVAAYRRKMSAAVALRSACDVCVCTARMVAGTPVKTYSTSTCSATSQRFRRTLPNK